MEKTVCRAFFRNGRNEEFDRSQHRVALQETQKCGHRNYTWRHRFSTLDNASQKCCEQNKCQNPTCPRSRQKIVPPMATKTITAFVARPSEWHTTGTVTPVGKITKAASPLKFH